MKISNKTNNWVWVPMSKWFCTGLAAVTGEDMTAHPADRNSIKVSTWKKIPFPDENSIYTKMT